MTFVAGWLLMLAAVWRRVRTACLLLAAVAFPSAIHLAATWWVVREDVYESYCSAEAVRIDRTSSAVVMYPLAARSPPMRPVGEGRVPSSCDTFGPEELLLSDLTPWLALNGMVQSAALVAIALAVARVLPRWRRHPSRSASDAPGPKED